MTVRRLAIGAVLLSSFVGPGQAQESAPPRQSTARVAAQAGLGTLATPVGFFGGGLLAEQSALALGATERTADRAGYIGAYTGAWLAAAAVPAWIGRDGRFSMALAGSAAGMGGAVLSVKLGNALYDEGGRRCGPACWTLGLLSVGLPSIGATIAYALSRD